MSFVFNQTMKQDQTQRTFEECLTILPTPGTEMQPCELHAQEWESSLGHNPAWYYCGTVDKSYDSWFAPTQNTTTFPVLSYLKNFLW